MGEGGECARQGRGGGGASGGGRSACRGEPRVREGVGATVRRGGREEREEGGVESGRAREEGSRTSGDGGEVGERWTSVSNNNRAIGKHRQGRGAGEEWVWREA